MSPNYDDYTIIHRNYGRGGSGHVRKHEPRSEAKMSPPEEGAHEK